MIPIIDFSNLSTKNGRIPSQENWTSVAVELDRALSTIGFVYIINHDVDQRKISRAFETSKHFFEQPQNVKGKYLKDTTKSYHGYSSPGQELLHPDSSHEARESYDFVNNSHPYQKNDIPDFDLAHIELKNECKPLIKNILRILAISLEMEDENYFINSSQNIDEQSIQNYSALRTIYYPAVGEDIVANSVRCAVHSDYGILTLLFQDNIGGLEVQTVDNKWIPATPIPGSILINTGDLLEFWSNGYFPATKHRVLIPEAEIRRKIPRQSIVYFHHPDDSAIVTPLTGKRFNNIDQHIYGTTTAGDHAKKRLESSYKY